MERSGVRYNTNRYWLRQISLYGAMSNLVKVRDGHMYDNRKQ